MRADVILADLGLFANSAAEREVLNRDELC